jgi:hypothetical protein
MSAPPAELPAKLDARITRSEGCWLWGGPPASTGYGQVRWEGRPRHTHRLVYELLVGPVPEGLVLDHKCRTRLCVNPEHLEPVTHRENILRGVGLTAVHARKTHCPAGHAYSPSNTRIYGGKRHCLACQRERPIRRRRGAA